MKPSNYFVYLLLLLASCSENNDMKSTYTIMENISVASNITYKTIDSTELQLDVYFPAKKLGEEPWEDISDDYKPTLIYFHGGGWVEGDRTSRFLGLLPYLEKGWCVVNVDYRLLQKTNLIGCLNDCIDAINWVHKHAPKYKFDKNEIYLSGESAGGHLALLSGMINTADVNIHQRESKIKGIINWYGITQMDKAIQFWNDTTYTNLILDRWDGDIAKYLYTTSPVSHVAPTTPPIITIHGDKDVNVEIEQAILLHQALETVGVQNELITIPGKKHGDFSSEELTSTFTQIWNFLGIRN